MSSGRLPRWRSLPEPPSWCRAGSAHVPSAGRRGRLRAGTALIARGEFSIVIAGLGAGTRHGKDLGALAAGYVLLTAIGGPLIAKFSDRAPAEKDQAAT